MGKKYISRKWNRKFKQIESLDYILLSEAPRYCRYSHDYLRLRARQGSLKALKMGRNWKTTREWLREYEEKFKNFERDEDKYKKWGPPDLKPASIIEYAVKTPEIKTDFWSFAFIASKARKCAVDFALSLRRVIEGIAKEQEILKDVLRFIKLITTDLRHSLSFSKVFYSFFVLTVVFGFLLTLSRSEDQIGRVAQNAYKVIIKNKSFESGILAFKKAVPFSLKNLSSLLDSANDHLSRSLFGEPLSGSYNLLSLRLSDPKRIIREPNPPAS
ncbi:MAG: hypothetical protein PHQ47_01675, partial [Candidatus Portnoybacteria bacterium]|nr:hypothetical protein [Candidatus Portnoybacteria bacterium]